MLVIPALGLRSGQAVPPGDASPERSDDAQDPVYLVQALTAAGFTWVHLADLDAAAGTGDNRALVRDVARLVDGGLQVEGGIGEADEIQALLDDGVDRVVVGTRGVEDPPWLERTTEEFPERLLLALDLRGRRVLSRGGNRDTRRDVLDLICELERAPFAGLIVGSGVVADGPTAAELGVLEEIVALSPWPVTARLAAPAMQDLHDLEARGLAAAAVATSSVHWPLDPRVVAEEFAA